MGCFGSNCLARRAVFIALFGQAFNVGLAQTRLWVAPNGNDTWSGTLAAPNGKGDGPKATLAGARDAIRALKILGKLSAQGAIVTVRPGRYQLLQPLEFGQLDSGASGARIIWRSEVIGQAIVDGTADVTKWLPANQRPNLDKFLAGVRPSIVVADLKANGIQETGVLRHMTPEDQFRLSTWAELYYDGARMPLAGFPNKGQCRMTGLGNGNSWDLPTGRTNLNYLLAPDYTKTDQNADDPFSEFWLRGSLNNPGSQFQERVSWLDHASGSVRIELSDGRVGDGSRHASFDPANPSQFSIVNSIYDLDSPGEYFIDRKAGQLYFYPPKGLAGHRVSLSMNPGPMILFNGAKYMDWQAFTLEGSRTDGVLAQNSTSVVIRGCKVHNVGNACVRITGGNSVTVRSCELYDAGEEGVYVTGGSRAGLVKSWHMVDNNYIHNVGSVQPYARPGVWVEGCGVTVQNNEIAFHRDEAIHFLGNEHTIKRNNIHDVLTDTTDGSAINASADWTMRGNQVVENYLHDIKTIRMGQRINHGIYLDDMFSSANVDRNVFMRVEQPIQIGGGHDCSANSNVMIDCTGGVRIDSRGLEMPDWWIQNFYNKAAQVPWQGSVWKNKYPSLYLLLTLGDPKRPSGNSICNNLFLRSKTNQKIGDVLELWGANANADPSVLVLLKNVITDTEQFVNEAAGNLTPLSGSQAEQIGIKPFTLSWAGVQKDTFIDPAKWQ